MEPSSTPPRPEIRDLKRGLRQEVLKKLAALTEGERASRSAKACELIRAEPLWARSAWVMFYAPMPGELDIWPLVETALAAGKTIALPRFVPSESRYVARRVRVLDRDIEIGHFGIREPVATCESVPLNRLDLVLVPGVAFDLHGRRLGRGKGYYDQVLAEVRGKTCGVAFDEQVVEEVPVEPHDALLTGLLTPTRWIEL